MDSPQGIDATVYTRTCRQTHTHTHKYQQSAEQVKNTIIIVLFSSLAPIWLFSSVQHWEDWSEVCGLWEDQQAVKSRECMCLQMDSICDSL